jgi:hypothetical protein
MYLEDNDDAAHVAADIIMMTHMSHPLTLILSLFPPFPRERSPVDLSTVSTF